MIQSTRKEGIILSDTTIIKIIFGILLTIGGSILLFLSFKLYYKYLIQEKRCTTKTKGIIKKYSVASYGDAGIHLPIVYYVINGKEYKVKGPEYKLYKTISKSSPFSDNSMDYSENNQILTIKRIKHSNITIMKDPIYELYPLHSEIDVYYDPTNPKLAYVLRYCDKKWTFWLTFISACILFILDASILILL